MKIEETELEQWDKESEEARLRILDRVRNSEAHYLVKVHQVGDHLIFEFGWRGAVERDLQEWKNLRKKDA